MSEKGKEKLTEQQQRMASAWLDQELPEDERDVIESQLVDGDDALRKEIESYRIVRNEFRGWFEKEIGAISRNVSLWGSIEQRLKAEAQSKAAGAGSFRERAAQIAEALQALFARPAFIGGVAAFAAALLFLATERGTPESGVSSDSAAKIAARESTGPATQLASQSVSGLGERDALMIEALQGGSSGSEQLASTEQPVNPDLLTTVGFEDLRRSLPSKLPVPDSLAVKLLSSPQLIVQDDIPGGLRAGGADIEWIKTQRPFKLVSSRRAQTPPVVWVRAR